MDIHKILCRLSATLLLLNSTVSYASAATPFNTYTDKTVTGSAVSGSAVAGNSVTKKPVTQNSIADSFVYEEPVTMQKEELQSSPITMKSLRQASQTKGIFDNKTYTHNDIFDGMNVYNGIDVSYYNKTIDWEEVKNSGVDFAIIRVGYRGYGAAGNLCTDTKFVENIEGALNAGIQVGVYYFTEAINKQEAIEEAEYCLEKIKDYNVTLPVAIDYEFPTDSNGPVGRMYSAKLSKTTATNNCIAFCDTIREAGYEPMVYANKSDFTNLLNGTKLSQSYKIWIANYTTKTTYSNQYEYWQYTESGSVGGISGKVDCNFLYTNTKLNNSSSNNNVITVPPASSTVTATPVITEQPVPSTLPTATPVPAATPVAIIDLSGAEVPAIPDKTYTGSEIMPALDIVLNGSKLIKNKDYEVKYSDNINAGKATVTITGIGNYKGTITSCFIIKPSKTSFFSGTPANKKITLSWDGKTGAQGYQIYRADVYNGTYTKIKTITDGTITSYKNTNLLTDHEYYYKIRSYTKIDGKTYYSSYTTLTAATMKTRQAAISSAKLDLLKTPGSASSKLVTIPKNSTVEYLGRTYLNDNTTYLHINYVVKSKTYNGYLLPEALLKFYSLGKTTAALNMRQAAGTNKKVLVVIPSGTPVALLQKVTVQSTIWYKTSYHDGKKLYTGYVSSGYIK